MLLLLLAWLDPLHGEGYQFWSGIGADFGEASILTALGVLLYHHNCHVKGCLWLGHRDPAHGFPACRRHHSKGDLYGQKPRRSGAPGAGHDPGGS